MKDINISILGFDVIRKQVPENVQEINEAAKDDDAAYNMALNQWMFHSDFSKLRPAICELVEKETGVEREKHEEEGARGTRTIYDEKEKAFLERVGEMVDEGAIEGVDQRKLTEIVQRAVDSVPVSLEKQVRGVGSGEPAKKWLAYYDQAIEDDVLEEKIENINNSSYYTGSPLDSDDEDLRVKFALACKEIVTKKIKEIADI